MNTILVNLALCWSCEVPDKLKIKSWKVQKFKSQRVFLAGFSGFNRNLCGISHPFFLTLYRPLSHIFANCRSYNYNTSNHCCKVTAAAGQGFGLMLWRKLLDWICLHCVLDLCVWSWSRFILVYLCVCVCSMLLFSYTSVIHFQYVYKAIFAFSPTTEMNWAFIQRQNILYTVFLSTDALRLSSACYMKFTDRGVSRMNIQFVKACPFQYTQCTA